MIKQAPLALVHVLIGRGRMPYEYRSSATSLYAMSVRMLQSMLSSCQSSDLNERGAVCYMKLWDCRMPCEALHWPKRA